MRSHQTCCWHCPNLVSLSLSFFPPLLLAVDPDVGLEVMSRLLHQAASAANVWSWQQALFVGNVFLWDNIVRAMPAVPPFLQEFARER